MKTFKEGPVVTLDRRLKLVRILLKMLKWIRAKTDDSLIRDLSA